MEKRKKDENLLIYIKKVLNQVESGILSYEDMGNLILEDENSYSSENLRKAYYVLKKIFSKMEDEIYSDSDMLKELSVAKFDLQKERHKLSIEKSIINEKARNESRADLLIENMITSIEKLKPIEVKKYKKTKTIEQTGFLCLADIHYGKEINLRTVNDEVVNMYNPKIFESRMWDLLHKLEVEDFYYKKLVIFGLGDYVENIHRISTLNKLKYGFVESVMKFSEFMAVWLDEAQDALGVEIEFQLIGGNHDEIRPITNKSGDFPEEDSVKMIYEFIRLRLINNKNIKIKLANQICFYNFYGLNVVGEHGIGDDEKILRHLEEFHGMEIDILVTGHLHSKTEKTLGVSSWLGDKLAIRVNSVVGACDYSKKIRKLARAGCKFMLFNDDGVDLEKTIYLN